MDPKNNKDYAQAMRLAATGLEMQLKTCPTLTVQEAIDNLREVARALDPQGDDQ